MRKNKLVIYSKITKFIKTYNGTIYQKNGVSRAQMQENKDLEVEYIVDSINKQNKIESITRNYKLIINDKIRLIEPTKTLKKTR
jgi:hypothetical protein